MKYQVELRRSFSLWGRTTIDAANDGHASVLAHTLQAADIAVWKTADDFLDIVSVTPTERNSHHETDAAGCNSDQVPPEIRGALERVIDYLYEDEAEHYDALTNQERVGHIFEAVLTIARWHWAPVRQR